MKETSNYSTWSRVTVRWIVATLLLLPLNAAIGFRSIHQLLETDRLERDAHDTVLALERLLVTLINAETGQRGFLLTGSTDYLTPYNQALPDIENQFRTLETKLGPEVLTKLGDLRRVVGLKLGELERTIKLRGAEGVEAALSVVKSNIGRQHMLEARQLVAEMQQQQKHLLAARSSQSSRSGQNAYLTLSFISLLNILLLVTVIRAVRREMGERLRGAAMLKEREAQFRSTFEQAAVGMAHVNLAGRFSMVNACLCKILGYSREELADLPLQKLTGDVSALENLAKLRSESRLHFTADLECKRKDNEPVWLRVTASLVQDGDDEPRYYLFVAEDITARVQAEEALSQVESRFQLLVEQIEDYAIYLIDREGNITSWNAGAQKLHLFEESEVIGKHHLILYPQGKQEQEQAGNCLKVAETRGHYSEEAWGLRKDGSIFWAHTSITALKDKKGALFGFSKVIRDLTERKRAEAEIRSLADTLEQRVIERTLELEEANVALEGFSYSVSHDLRAPLRGMHGLAMALLEDYGDLFDDMGREFATRIITAATDMDRLILDLLDYSRLSRREIKTEPIPLSYIVETVMKQFQDDIMRSKATVQVSLSGSEVLANKLVLTQIVGNLLGNGLKFVREGTSPDIRIWDESDGETVSFYLEDQGIGIDPEHHQRIFQVFERLHANDQYPGTGVGLAIVRKGVERMGGKVSVDSIPGEKSTFRIELPAAPEREAVLESFHEESAKI